MLHSDLPQYKTGGNGYFKVGYRALDFATEPHLIGRERAILLANGEKRRSIFAIVELDSIFPSHDPYTFASTENYPTNERGENVNDRNYSNDKNAQANVLRVAQNFEPEIQISTSVTSAGLPIITVDGIVVSGNNRVMSFKRMVQDFPENYNAYKQVLAQEIDSFGFNNYVGTALLMNDKISLPGSSFHAPLSVTFKTPILVRIDLDFPEYTTTELSKYNKDTKKSERPIDKAIKLSSMLLDNQGCFNSITAVVSTYETFTDLYSNISDCKRLEAILLQCNIITKNEIAQYFVGGTFTSAGKELIENLLAGMILDKESLIASEAQGVKFLKQRLIVSLPVLIKNAGFKENSLKTDIQLAIKLQSNIAASGLKFGEFLGQYKMFDTPNYTYQTYVINRLLNKSQIGFKQGIEAYNNATESNMGESLFGDKPTPSEIFENTIASKIESSDLALIKKVLSLSDSSVQETSIPSNSPIEARLRGLEILLRLEQDPAKRKLLEMRMRGLQISLNQ